MIGSVKGVKVVGRQGVKSVLLEHGRACEGRGSSFELRGIGLEGGTESGAFLWARSTMRESR